MLCPGADSTFVLTVTTEQDGAGLPLLHTRPPQTALVAGRTIQSRSGRKTPPSAAPCDALGTAARTPRRYGAFSMRSWQPSHTMPWTRRTLRQDRPSLSCPANASLSRQHDGRSRSPEQIARAPARPLLRPRPAVLRSWRVRCRRGRRSAGHAAHDRTPCKEVHDDAFHTLHADGTLDLHRHIAQVMPPTIIDTACLLSGCTSCCRPPTLIATSPFLTGCASEKVHATHG